MNDNRDHLRAYLAAYEEVTGIALSLTPIRRYALRDLDRLESKITPDDVRAVLRRIKQHMERGTPGYTDASLDFRNTLGKPERMEEWALRLRQEKLRKRKPAPAVTAQTHAAGDGSVVNVLAAPMATVPDVPAVDEAKVKEVLRKFHEEMGR